VYYLGEHGFFTMTIAQLIIAASTVALCTQIPQACFKVSLGILADHNVLSAFIIALACGISAILCFLFGYSFPAVIFTGGALYGSLFAVGDVLSPVLMRKFFGDLDYTKIYARFTLFVNIVPAFAIIVFAHLSNRSWVATFVVGIIALLTTLVLALIAMKKSKQLQDSFVTG